MPRKENDQILLVLINNIIIKYKNMQPPPPPPHHLFNKRGRDAMADLNRPPRIDERKKKEGQETQNGTICKPKPHKPPPNPDPPPPSYAKGGKVKKTGCAKLHKDEIVLPVSLVKQLAKLMK